MKKSIILALAFLPLLAFGQASYVSVPLNSTSFVSGIKVLTPMNAAVVQFCTAPANATPCTNYATTYTDSTATVPCNGSNGCSNPTTADASGNWAVWALSGQYQYTVTYQGQSFGPYSITLPIATSGTASFTTLTGQNINAVLRVGSSGYSTIAGAETAAGMSNNTKIVIDPSTADTGCPTYQSNLVFEDWRTATATTVNCTQNTIEYNANYGSVNAMVKEQMQASSIGSNTGLVSHWFVTNLNNGTVSSGSVLDGMSATAQSLGTLTGTLGNMLGAEVADNVFSTGGTITNAIGVQGFVEDNGNASRSNITNAVGVDALGSVGLLTSTNKPTNAYGLWAHDQQGTASGRNYSIRFDGLALGTYSAFTASSGIDLEDTGNVARHILYIGSSNTATLQAANTNGVALASSDGAQQAVATAGLFHVTNGLSINGGSTIADSGKIVQYAHTFTTTAAASDTFTLSGVTINSQCGFSAANASAATNIATSYISAVGANSVTLTHTATASMNYTIFCTAD